MSISRTRISDKEQKQHWGRGNSAQEGASRRVGTCRHSHREMLTRTTQAGPQRVATARSQAMVCATQEDSGRGICTGGASRRVGTSRHCVTEYLQQDRSTGTLPCALVGFVRTSTDPKDFVTTSETTSTQRSLSLVSRQRGACRDPASDKSK